MPPIPIDGINTGNTKPWPVPDPMPMRREIDEWFDNEPAQVNLFLQAYKDLQEVDQHEQLSYFKVAAIHYYPTYSWTGDDDDQQERQGVGYCAHANIKFGTWHRPYMALMEELIQKRMLDLAQNYADENDREMYIKAATEWRLPFWDWGLRKERDGKSILTIPKLLEEEYRNIPIVRPDGTQTTIPNPLQAYNFDRSNPSDPTQRIPVGEPIETCKQTIRYPPVWDRRDPEVVKLYLNGVQRNDSITKAFNNANPSLSDRVYNTLNLENYLSFIPFFFDRRNPPSLEGIHNTIHGLIGGGGHMSNPAYAAFDPIFWLHHCNVDRLLAIWQELHESSWFTSDDRSGQTFTPRSPLQPFYHTSGGRVAPWDSNAARHHFTLGYSYPGLDPWLEKYSSSGSFDRDAYKRDIQAMIARNYGQVQRVLWQNNGLNIDTGKPAEAAPLTAATAQVQLMANIPSLRSTAAADTADTDSEAPAPPPQIEYDDYVANISFERFALNNGEPFTVFVFLGPFDTSASAAPGWVFEKSLVGTIYNFVTPEGVTGEASCDNCVSQQQNRVKVGGQVPLTSAILEAIAHGDISNLRNREEITAYLKQNLKWRVATAEGTDVPREIPDMESLEVEVARCVAVSPNEEGKFTERGEYETIYEVTQDKARGARPPTTS